MSVAEAPEVRTMVDGETRIATVSFLKKLDSGELLTGTPTVAEISTSDLTISNAAVNTGALTHDVDAALVAGQAVQFRVLGGTVGTTYRILITCTTDSSPAQTVRLIVELEIAPAT